MKVSVLLNARISGLLSQYMCAAGRQHNCRLSTTNQRRGVQRARVGVQSRDMRRAVEIMVMSKRRKSGYSAVVQLTYNHLHMCLEYLFM